jgi:hypothetical protein
MIISGGFKVGGGAHPALPPKIAKVYVNSGFNFRKKNETIKKAPFFQHF